MECRCTAKNCDSQYAVLAITGQKIGISRETRNYPITLHNVQLESWSGVYTLRVSVVWQLE